MRRPGRRTTHALKIGTIKLDLEELEKKERENMKNFIRSAKRHGTVSAINQYLVHDKKSSARSNDFGQISMLDLSKGNMLNESIHNPNQNNYYDDDSDEELPDYLKDDDLEEIDVGVNKSCLINPDGKFKYLWDNL
jgi:hypothetical protein